MKRLLLWVFILSCFLCLWYLISPIIPGNPFVWGYTKYESERSVVYTKNLALLKPIYKTLDLKIQDIENLYGLSLPLKTTVVVAESPFELVWYSGYFNNSLGSESSHFGSTIFIRPPESEDVYTEEELLKRELVYVLVSKYSSTFDLIKINRNAWVINGMATLYGGPHSYSELEFSELLKQKQIVYSPAASSLYMSFENQNELFRNTLYKYLIKYLIAKYGEDKFLAFINAYFANPAEYQLTAATIFGEPFTDIMYGFERQYGKGVNQFEDIFGN